VSAVARIRAEAQGDAGETFSGRPPRNAGDLAWGVLIRWWLVVLCALAGGMLAAPALRAHFVAHHAAASVGEQEARVVPGGGHQQVQIRLTPPSGGWGRSAIEPTIAAAAARSAGVSPATLLQGLAARQRTPSTVEISYTGAGSEPEARDRLNAYISALVAAHRSAQRESLVQLAQQYRSSQNYPAARAVQEAADEVGRRVARVGHARTSSTRPIPAGGLTALGWLLGLTAAAIPLAILIRRDERIRRMSELDRAGLPARYVDPGRGGSLRSLLAGPESELTQQSLLVLRCGNTGSALAPALETQIAQGGNVHVVDGGEPSAGGSLEGSPARDATGLVLSATLGRTTWPELERSLRLLQARDRSRDVSVVLAVQRLHRWRRASEWLLGTGTTID